MEKIFDIAKDSEQKWGVIAQGIDGNFERTDLRVSTLEDAILLSNKVDVTFINHGDNIYWADIATLTKNKKYFLQLPANTTYCGLANASGVDNVKQILSVEDSVCRFICEYDDIIKIRIITSSTDKSGCYIATYADSLESSELISTINDEITAINDEITQKLGDRDILSKTERFDEDTILGDSTGDIWYPFRINANNIVVSSDGLNITCDGSDMYQGVRRGVKGFIIGHTYRLTVTYRTTNELKCFIGPDLILMSMDNTDNEWYTISRDFTFTSMNDRVQFALYSKVSITYYLKDLSIIDLTQKTLESRIDELESSVGHPLAGKNVSVIGDSISSSLNSANPYCKILSTDVGTIMTIPITWLDVYTDYNGDVLTNKTVGGITLTADMIGKIQKFTIASEDVGKVIGLPIIYNSSSIKTWIEVLCNKAGATLIGNGAYSGASLCDGQADTRYAGVEGFSEWTMGTLKQRDDDGNDILPDVVFIYRGTNDMTHSMTKGGFARIDSYDIAMNGYPTTDEDDDSYSFRKAYIMTIKKIRDTYPNAKIYCCTLNIFKRITYDRFPTRNGYYSLPQINQCIREIADEMGCGLVELDKDGITFENCYPTYISDSETTPTHPNQTGHNVMAERAYRDTMGFNGL